MLVKKYHFLGRGVNFAAEYGDIEQLVTR